MNQKVTINYVGLDGEVHRGYVDRKRNVEFEDRVSREYFGKEFLENGKRKIKLILKEEFLDLRGEELGLRNTTLTANKEVNVSPYDSVTRVNCTDQNQNDTGFLSMMAFFYFAVSIGYIFFDTFLGFFFLALGILFAIGWRVSKPKPIRGGNIVNNILKHKMYDASSKIEAYTYPSKNTFKFQGVDVNYWVGSICICIKEFNEIKFYTIWETEEFKYPEDAQKIVLAECRRLSDKIPRRIEVYDGSSGEYKIEEIFNGSNQKYVIEDSNL